MTNKELIEFIGQLLPDVEIVEGSTFSWSPEHRVITYSQKSPDKTPVTWALLHEASHALLEHKTYSSDIELLKLEVAAWDKAKELAKETSITIDNNHIEDCIDSYRDWLFSRSKCPDCGVASIQVSSFKYHCHNCNAEWVVSSSRFCRPYRLTVSAKKEKRSLQKTATFS